LVDAVDEHRERYLADEIVLDLAAPAAAQPADRRRSKDPQATTNLTRDARYRYTTEV
jgi:hypothetical protein